MNGGYRWTSLIGAGVRAYLSRRIRRISDRERWKRESGALQRVQLRSILARAAGTEFGREHGFTRLARLPDADLARAYRAAVPVADWYAFREMIARMREGAEPDVLWPGVVRDFAQTSGTTAGDKFIPVSREMLRSNFRASLDIFACLNRLGLSLPRLLGGKVLFLGGSSDLASSDKGVRTGDLSGIVTPLIRWPLSEIYLPGPKIALMSHWPSKIEAMAARCLGEDVRMVSGMPSWALVLFDRLLSLARERGGKAGTLRDIWPNLSVFVHGGVKYAPFDARVRQFWSGSPDGQDVPNRLELYPASEAFIAIQDEPNSGETLREGRAAPLRLLTDIGNYFEFIPLESVSDPDPPAFACDEVEKGVRYVVVPTTCAGLYRYVLGDVVEFDEVPDGPARKGDGPPRLRIVGRHRHFINAFGENLIVEHIENAVADAARAAGMVVGEFTAAPVYPAPGRKAGLELAVEVESKPGGAAPDVFGRFRDAFDRSLKEQNVDYTTKRTDDLSMAPPTITPLPPGTFHRWLESKGKLGGQHKCPRCANGREILDGVVGAAGNNEPR